MENSKYSKKTLWIARNRYLCQQAAVTARKHYTWEETADTVSSIYNTKTTSTTRNQYVQCMKARYCKGTLDTGREY